MNIVKFPTPSLLEKSIEIELNEENLAFIEELKEFYKSLTGTAVGIAAPQVGKNIRVFIAQGGVYINPIIHKKSKETYKAWEGCLSIPKQLYRVERHKDIDFEWTDADGVKHKENIDGFRAEVIQHEYDHLEGVLINQ